MESIIADKIRSVLFATFVASGFLPMVHACMLDGTDVLGLFPLLHTLGMEACYFTGVIFYITRFPEKLYPKTFDIWVRTASQPFICFALLMYAGIKPSNISCGGRGRPDGVYYRTETYGFKLRTCVGSNCSTCTIRT